MTRFATRCLWLVSAVMVLPSLGCNAAAKALLMDQGVGFVSAIGAAASASIVQALFGT